MKLFHRVVAALVPALAAAIVATAVAAGPAHAVGDASLRILSPLEPQSVVGSAISVEVEVNLGSAPKGTLYTMLWTAQNVRVVTQDECPDTCTLQLVLDPASFDNALDNNAPTMGVRVELLPEGGGYLVDYSGEVDWTAAAGNTTNGTLVAPVETLTRTGYAAWVSDTGIAVGVRSDVHTRESGEVIEGRLYHPGLNGAPGGEALATSTGAWGTNLEGSAAFDTSALPEGEYVVRVRVRSAAGGYASGGDRTILVRHHPSVTIHVEPLAQLDGAGYARLSIEGPRASTSLPKSDAVIEVDGTAYTVPTQTSRDPWTYPMSDARARADITLGAPRTAVRLGFHDYVVKLLSDTGATYAPASSARQEVADFTSTMTATTMFVGRAVKMRLVATSPQGHPFTDCWASVQADLDSGSGFWDSLCAPGSTTTDRSFSWTPASAGAVSYGHALRAADNLLRDRRTDAVVHAARNAKVTAPATTYGATGTVSVALTDLSDVRRSPVAAPSGVPVSLELRKAGSSTWSTIASAKTVTGGTAKLTYTSRYNGTFRVRYASTAPGLTEVSGSLGAWSKAAVAWSTVPTSTYVGRSTLFRVTAKPYQAGAKAALQARPVGGAWETMRTVSVTSGGWATFSTSFPGRGPYEVRVVRYGTTLNSTAYSSTRRVTVR